MIENSTQFWIGALQADRDIQLQHIARHEQNHFGRACVQAALSTQVGYVKSAFELYLKVVELAGYDSEPERSARWIFGSMILNTEKLKVKYEGLQKV